MKRRRSLWSRKETRVLKRGTVKVTQLLNLLDPEKPIFT